MGESKMKIKDKKDFLGKYDKKSKQTLQIKYFFLQ